jgi:hypothetical protein
MSRIVEITEPDAQAYEVLNSVASTGGFPVAQGTIASFAFPAIIAIIGLHSVDIGAEEIAATMGTRHSRFVGLGQDSTGHAERLEDAFCHKVVQRGAALLLDD